MLYKSKFFNNIGILFRQESYKTFIMFSWFIWNIDMYGGPVVSKRKQKIEWALADFITGFRLYLHIAKYSFAGILVKGINSNFTSNLSYPFEYIIWLNL